jgi:nicotinate-nucleotide pyrophosphorylase (carboxylating)
MPSLNPTLPDLMIEAVVRAALLEDLGRAGDITTDALVPDDAMAEAFIASRQQGIVFGVTVAALAFRLVSPGMTCEFVRGDSGTVRPGEVVMRIAGPARAMLTGERTALNFLCHLSGIATATAALVEAAKGTKARITCTRKTTPTLRFLEKAAVRAGGGANHRFGLDDAVLIKDNHVALAGAAAAAVNRVREQIGHLVKIEVEVDTLAQLHEAMTAAPDAVLLDKMPPDMLREAVGIVDSRAVTEASGGITLEAVPAIAASGVDLISAGWLTHSAKSLDLGLDIQMR